MVEIPEKKLLVVEERLGKCLNNLQDLIRDSENGTLSAVQLENRGRKILNSLFAVLDPIQDEISDAYMRSSNR